MLAQTSAGSAGRPHAAAICSAVARGIMVYQAVSPAFATFGGGVTAEAVNAAFRSTGESAFHSSCLLTWRRWEWSGGAMWLCVCVAMCVCGYVCMCVSEPRTAPMGRAVRE